jgi:hypothetical protein
MDNGDTERERGVMGSRDYGLTEMDGFDLGRSILVDNLKEKSNTLCFFFVFSTPRSEIIIGNFVFI